MWSGCKWPGGFDGMFAPIRVVWRKVKKHRMLDNL